VKVWRSTIVEEHPDQDPIERADRRHPCEADFTTSLDYSPQAASVPEMLRRIWLKADVVVDGIAEPLLAARYRSVVCTLT
jgi:hypothetical protein